MLDFTFCSPTQFVFGREAQHKAGEMLRQNGATKVLIHYGGGSVIRSGLLGQVKASIEAVGIPYVELGGAQPNPVDSLVYEGINLGRREGVDFVLALGGGSAIDSAKAMADGIPYDGDFWDFFEGRATVEKALPVGVVLTIPAAGSEASDSSVITKQDGMFKRGLGSEWHRPRFALMNPELTYTLPPAQTANGIADMMAHVLERYFTNTTGVDLTDQLCEAVLRSIMNAAQVVKHEPTDYDARATLMWAGTLAHNNSLGLGRQQDWSSHRIEHELSALYDVAHGAGLAVVFPAWMTFVLPEHVQRFVQFAVRVMGCQMDYEQPERTAREGIERLKRFWGDLGLPLNFAQLGAKAEDIPLMASKVKYTPEGTLGSFTPLKEADVIAILEIAAR